MGVKEYLGKKVKEYKKSRDISKAREKKVKESYKEAMYEARIKNAKILAQQQASAKRKALAAAYEKRLQPRNVDYSSSPVNPFGTSLFGTSFSQPITNGSKKKKKQTTSKIFNPITGEYK